MRLSRVGIEAFDSLALAERAQIHGTDAEEVVILRAELDGVECGLVVLDLVSGDDDEAQLIEIFVIPSDRDRGMGTRILEAVDDFARSAGKRRITLQAEPLDDDDDDTETKPKLIRWYLRRGYRPAGGPWDELEKRL